MRYQCSECQRIWTTYYEAEKCCQPIVVKFRNDETMPCQMRGEDCEDDRCIFCQGTGWQRRSDETVKP